MLYLKLPGKPEFDGEKDRPAAKQWGGIVFV